MKWLKDRNVAVVGSDDSIDAWPSGWGPTCPAGYLISMSDPFGNEVTLTWGANTLDVVQSLGNGESRTVHLGLAADGLPTSLAYNNKTWTYVYPVPGQLAEVILPGGVQGGQIGGTSTPRLNLKKAK